MEINGFERMRLNSEKKNPIFMDIQSFEAGCSSGFMAIAREIGRFPSETWARHKIEVRKQGIEIALIVYKYDDSELPFGWENAEILYSWEEAK